MKTQFEIVLTEGSGPAKPSTTAAPAMPSTIPGFPHLPLTYPSAGQAGGAASAVGAPPPITSAAPTSAGAPAGAGTGLAGMVAGLPPGVIAAGAAVVGSKIAQAVSSSLERMVGFFRNMADKQTDYSASLAQQNAAASIKAAGEVKAAWLEHIPIVGNAIAGIVRMQSTEQERLSKVASAFNERAKDLQGYSGEIAGAQANAEIKQILADIREAQVSGKQMGELIQAQKDFELEFRKSKEQERKETMKETVAELKKQTAELKEVNRRNGVKDVPVVDPMTEFMNLATLVDRMPNPAKENRRNPDVLGIPLIRGF